MILLQSKLAVFFWKKFKYDVLVQVFLGQNGVRDIDGNELPRLVYVSREKRPGFEHHKKAGAMNALVESPLSLSLSCR